MPEKMVAENDKLKIGSFRNTSNLKDILPDNIYGELFNSITDKVDVTELITVHDKKKAFLNNGAFGRAYDDVRKLGKMLREYAEEMPDVFYDQVCIPLLKYSYSIVEEFFQTDRVLLVPNCSMAMKTIAENLFQKSNNSCVAYLSPLYGATKKLLEYYQLEGHICDIIDINPGLIEEDPLNIMELLENAYSFKPFSVLFCDETASQSGRVLPLAPVVKFCNIHSIKIVVDGTQSCELFMGSNINILDDIDYFVMSTHKWMGNIKTCGVIRYKNEAPTAPVISFGWTPDQSTKSIQSSYIWQGMLDTYIPYITLSKALKLFQKYGRKQLSHSATLLNTSFSSMLKVTPLLSCSKERVLNIFQLEDSHLEELNTGKLQNQIQNYGVFISAKKTTNHQVNAAIYLNGDLCENINKRKNKSIQKDGANEHENGYVNGNENGYMNGNENGYMNGHENGYMNGNDEIGYKNGHDENGYMNGDENGYKNGDENGYTNEDENGYANGHGNGCMNGGENGYMNGHEKDYMNGHENEYMNGNRMGSVEHDVNFKNDKLVSTKNMKQIIRDRNQDRNTSKELISFLRVSSWSYNTKDDFEKLSALLHHNIPLSSASKSSLRSEFLSIYELYEKLFSVLETNAYFIRAEKLRHHLIFYYAHTAVFYINKMIVAGHMKVAERINPQIESLMSVGVDEMSWDDLLEENYDWVGLDDSGREYYLENIRNYRKQVKDLVLKKIESIDLVTPIVKGSFHWALLMGIEHERIHLETSAVIISQVPIHLIKKNHAFNFPTFWKGKANFENISQETLPQPEENKLLRVPGGVVYMGKVNLEQDYYGWDNETGTERKDLEDFQASKMLVSNTEYLQFIEDGGYSNNEWWSEEGWKYVTVMKVSAPRFWIGRTHYRAMLEETPMPWNLPVEVTNLEAEAFCKWKSSKLGKEVRLISYEESFHMRQIALNEASNNNLNKYGSPTPVNFYGGQIGNETFYDISGNVWRHSCSVLTVMEGFKTDPLYNDFTLPTIDGFHNHILGGSWISIGNSANLNSRFGFRRHFMQYAGIRYVLSNNSYHDRVLKMYDEVEWTKQITEHYTDFTGEIALDKKPVTNWPKLLGQKAGEVINNSFKSNNNTNVLVVYGGVGRSTLEILKSCSNLTIHHTDASANYLQVLGTLLEESRIQWYQQIEGKITEALEFSLQSNESPEIILKNKNSNVSYYQADYENMRPQFNNYDVAVIDFRFKDCHNQLLHVSNRLSSNGILILGSIQSPQEKDFQDMMNKYFSLIDANNGREYPHMYRETVNKHQYAVSYISIWRKKVVETIDVQVSLATEKESDYYESKGIVASYTEFHFGDMKLPLRNFFLRLVDVAITACKNYDVCLNNVLDAGCGPGRTAVEFCKYFKTVDAYDYSESLTNILKSQQRERNLRNLHAYVGDAHKQKEKFIGKTFDLIFASNLIDRLHSPKTWLQQSKEMLSPGGLLIIASPYTWKAEFTEPSKWIGGFKKDAEDYYTVNGLCDIMLPELHLLEQIKVPFMIPDEDGTFQYTYSNCTIFGAK